MGSLIAFHRQTGAEGTIALHPVPDPSAFGVLYQRHFEAVQSLARELVPSPAEADHLVAETFALVHEATQSGGGPTDAFRPYVLTALRRAAGGRLAEPAPVEPAIKR